MMNAPKDAANDLETNLIGATSWANLSTGGTSDAVEAEPLLTFQMPKRSSTWPLDPSHDNTLPAASSDQISFETLDDYSETSTELTEPWCPSFEPQPLSVSLNPLHVDAMHDAYHLPWLSQGLCTTTSEIHSGLSTARGQPESTDLWYSGALPYQFDSNFDQAMYAGKAPLTDTVEPQAMIGSVHRDQETGAYSFKCCDLKCNHKTFRRMYDLARHHDGTHAAAGPAFWCVADGCERSADVGDRPFPRKDKLKDHVRKVHGGMDGT